MSKNSKISHWNYRVLKTINSSGVEEFGIVEVYYDRKRQPFAYTDYQIPWGENLKDLKWDTSKMLKACREPILTEEDFKKKKKGKK